MTIEKLSIAGFKSFREASLTPSRLAIIVGPNGSGKSSLIEILQLLHNSIDRDIPPEVIEGTYGQQIYHAGGPPRIFLNIDIVNEDNEIFTYTCTITGPLGSVFFLTEDIYNTSVDKNFSNDNTLLSRMREEQNVGIQNHSKFLKLNSLRKRSLLSTIFNSHTDDKLFYIKESILQWAFYSSFRINSNEIRRSVLLQQTPQLNEDCSNLSSVLHYIMTEHPQVFNEIQFHLKQLVPGFSHLTVKARGGPGEVMAFWREQGVEQDLSLADLSDGILRLLCWMVLFLHPKPPTLICIDEPDLGVHPRTLPLLAALIKKASARTQIFVTTHNSYFLSQFDLENITVFRKENGATKAHKPKDSQTLVELLEEFGQGEIAAMHISEELELL